MVTSEQLSKNAIDLTNTFSKGIKVGNKAIDLTGKNIDKYDIADKAFGAKAAPSTALDVIDTARAGANTAEGVANTAKTGLDLAGKGLKAVAPAVTAAETATNLAGKVAPVAKFVGTNIAAPLAAVTTAYQALNMGLKDKDGNASLDIGTNLADNSAEAARNWAGAKDVDPGAATYGKSVVSALGNTPLAVGATVENLSDKNTWRGLIDKGGLQQEQQRNAQPISNEELEKAKEQRMQKQTQKTATMIKTVDHLFDISNAMHKLAAVKQPKPQVRQEEPTAGGQVAASLITTAGGVGGGLGLSALAAANGAPPILSAMVGLAGAIGGMYLGDKAGEAMGLPKAPFALGVF